ncbi:hypothetical protein [Nocardia shimofusensis]|uniref:hypothetical protein n=1 Tax=Nocardia shimofusensis TaxID=228596 RepID=UPI000A65FAAB|nr:hypothetical protein [Nocardia shimofusensis]
MRSTGHDHGVAADSDPRRLGIAHTTRQLDHAADCPADAHCAEPHGPTHRS